MPLFSKIPSKRGVSLVEEICAALVLVVAVAALVGGIGLSRGSVLRNNSEDAAAAQAQEIADTLIAKLSSSAETASGDILGDDAVDYRSDGEFSGPDAPEQYSYEPIADDETGSAGYRIAVRVYYGGGRYCQMTAYASDTGGAFNS